MIINKYNLLENLNNTYCTFGQSKVHGIGVVAIRDIPKDIDPFPPLMSEQLISITEEDLEQLPKEIISKIKDIFISVDGIYQIFALGLNSMGVRFHVNHSKQPNIAVNKEAFTSGYYPFITLRKIEKGEELFWDYTISNGDDILNQFKFLKND